MRVYTDSCAAVDARYLAQVVGMDAEAKNVDGSGVSFTSLCRSQEGMVAPTFVRAEQVWTRQAESVWALLLLPLLLSVCPVN